MASDAQKSQRLKPLGILSYLAALIAFCILLGLGTWQVERLHWKEDLLATIDTRRHSPPLPLKDVALQFDATKDVDYQTVTVSGVFEHEREQYFFATWEGATGFYVYTPLRLQDGRAVLINRGFIPYELKDPAKRQQGQISGEVTITGLARNPLAEKPSRIVPDNDLAKNIYYWKDRDAMARNAGLDPAKIVPFFIDADATPNSGGLPIGGVTLIDLPNSHLQYAVTWYGLAGALVVVFGSLAWKRRKGADVGRAGS